MARLNLTGTILALALLASGPAVAGGSFGITITAETAEGHRAISRFLSAYAGASAAARVVQRGSANTASVAQTGSGNRAVIGQYGTGHNGAVRQEGRGNRLGLFQFGRATDVTVTQSGDRAASVMLFGGW